MCGVDVKRMGHFFDTIFDEFKYSVLLLQEFSAVQGKWDKFNGHSVFCIPPIGGHRQPAIVIHRDFPFQLVGGPYAKDRSIAVSISCFLRIFVWWQGT